MKKLLLITALLMLCRTIFAQTEPCGYEAYRNHLIEQDSSNKILYHAKKQWVQQYRLENGFGNIGISAMPDSISCPTTRYIIPVVVHIVHLPSDNSPGTGTNISDGQVHHQIEKLNQDFASTGIQFCLAQKNEYGSSISGIARYSNTASTHKMPSEISSLFSLSNFAGTGSDKYLNVYVVHTILNDAGQDGGMLGYATLPGGGKQGIVIRHDWFGHADSCSSCTLDTNSKGTTLTHEAGHYLGLEHTFFQGCTTPDSCNTSGDLCCDTPPCTATFSCSTANTCNETYNGDLNDAIHNFMGYNEQSCMTEFSPQQIEIMHAVLENARAELVSPNNVNAKELSCCFLSAYFNADKTFLCTQLGADTVTFRAYDYENALYNWEIYDSAFNLVYSFSDSVAEFRQVFAATVQTYTVALEISRNGQSIALSRQAFILMADCGTPLPSTQGNWIFGEYAGIQFTDKGVIRDIKPFRNRPNAINTGEGTISVSDSNGIMLFHGGGKGSDLGAFYLFDRNYDTMPHGPVLGDGSSAQGGLVVPVPGQNSRYYLFTVASRFNTKPITTEGLRYSVIDMNLNNGNGDVDTNFKNIVVKAVPGVFPNPNDSAFMCGEVITSIPKCNSSDYWLLVGGMDSTSVAATAGEMYIYVFSTDSNGLTYHSCSDLPAGNMYGGLKVSPNGKYVFCSGTLYDFNRNTGSLTSIQQFSPLEGYYGACFSPDSKLLYSKFTNSSDYPSNTIFQFDLSYTDPEQSKKAIGTIISLTHTAMQLGPDGKIYIAQRFQDRLAVIENPNLRVSGNGTNECGFSTNGPLLSSGGIGGICGQGLPNFSDISEDINKLDFVWTDSACGNISFTPISCSTENTWYFGDGDSSLDLAPSHAYAAIGTYNVLLVSGGDSVSKQIHIGVNKPEISGNTIVCDTGYQYAYSIGNICFECEYIWNATGGTMSYGSNLYEKNIQWNSLGEVSVVAINNKNTCRDSAALIVINRYHLTNILTDSILYACNDLSPTIYGNDHNADSTTISYSWRTSTDSITWHIILGANEKNLQPDDIKDTTRYYQRVIVLHNCDTFLSNTTTLIPIFPVNELTITYNPPLKGCDLVIIGSEPMIDGLQYNYTWHYSDFINQWNAMPQLGDGKDMYGYIMELDSMLVFRKIAIVGCESHSDTLLIKPSARIIRGATDYYLCNYPVRFEVVLDNPQNLEHLIYWRRGDSTNGVFLFLTPYSASYTSYSSQDAVNGRLFTPTINIEYCDLFLDTATLYIPQAPHVWFIQQPTIIQDSSLGENTYKIVVKDSTLFEQNFNHKKIYQWQISLDSLVYSNINPTFINDGDSIIFNNPIPCHNNIWLRVIISDSAQTCFYGVSEGVKIQQLKNYDLWSKDSPSDTGAEPNYQSQNDYWNSPDIWNNRNSSNYSATHQNPVHGSTNKIHARIYNKGGGYSKPAKVYFYWTLPAGMEIWPLHWTYDLSKNFFYSADSSTVYPRGSEINFTGIDIGPMAPNSDTIVAYEWYPPDPSWYPFDSNGTTVYYNKRELCLLMRIVECDEEPYGMSFPEEKETTTNVKNNNNITTKNTTLFNESSAELQVRVVEYYPIFIESSEVSSLVTLTLRPQLGTGFFDYGQMALVLDDGLHAAWVEGGYQGSGFSIDGRRIVVVNPATFELSGIQLDSLERRQAAVELSIDSLPSLSSIPFRFLFRQYSDSNVEAIGGVYIEGEIPIKAPIAAEDRRVIVEDLADITNPDILSGEQEEIKEVHEQPQAESEEFIRMNKITVFPNPFTSKVNFLLELETEALCSIVLYNSLGAKVAVLNQKLLSEGKHLIPFDGSHLAPGIYQCVAKIGQQQQVLRVAIVR